jgi:hypothetical protein
MPNRNTILIKKIVTFVTSHCHQPLEGIEKGRYIFGQYLVLRNQRPKFPSKSKIVPISNMHIVTRSKYVVHIYLHPLNPTQNKYTD